MTRPNRSLIRFEKVSDQFGKLPTFSAMQSLVSDVYLVPSLII